MRLLILLLVLVLPSLSSAAPQGTEQRITTRDQVTVPVFVRWQENAKATLVLFSGGAGGYGKIGEEGWPTSGNFLIRTTPHWAAHPFNLVMVGRPSDGIDLGNGAIRSGSQHVADNLAVLRALRHQSPLPIWLVGTSMGTISAASTAIHDKEGLVAGLVLTSSITGRQIPGAVPGLDLSAIRIPTLIFHHENDACKHCQADEARTLGKGLSQAPIQKTLIVGGGANPTGSPCGPFHYHGYIGMEKEAVDRIAEWILSPAN